MPRFFIPSDAIVHHRVTLKGTDVHHIRNVLRLGTGDAVTLVTPGTEEHHAVIRTVSRSTVEVEILHTVPAREENRIQIALAQAVPKGNKMDMVIQKATELGVASIHPFTSSRTVPLPDEMSCRKRLIRWQRIAMEASKQCQRTTIPLVHTIKPLNEVIRVPGDDVLKILLWEKAPTAWSRVFDQSAHFCRFFILVGPEGGLAEHEVDACQREGFIPQGLGRRILRTETAALCMLAILQYQVGDLR